MINRCARWTCRPESSIYLLVVDRMPLEPPTIVVAVVGPPKVGKSTLISCSLVVVCDVKVVECEVHIILYHYSWNRECLCLF